MKQFQTLHKIAVIDAIIVVIAVLLIEGCITMQQTTNEAENLQEQINSRTEKAKQNGKNKSDTTEKSNNR